MFVHLEAFRLMTYSDGDSVSVRIWNSRDGVVPFSVAVRLDWNGDPTVSRDAAPDTERTVEHVNRSDDRLEPCHVPEVGDLVFIDWTYDEAEERAKDTIRTNWPDGPDPDTPSVRDLASQIYGDGERPRLVEVDEALHQRFRVAADRRRECLNRTLPEISRAFRRMAS